MSAMEIPKIKMPQLDGIKDRLGLGGEKADDGRRNQYGQYDDYDEYDDYDGNAGYDDYDDGYQDAFDDGVSRNASWNTRRTREYGDVGTLDASSSTRVLPAQISSNRYSGSPNLVSLNDVRAHTAATRSSQRVSGDVPERDANASSYAESPRTSASGSRGENGRSSGYNSLFGGTARNAGKARNIEIIRPRAYEDAESIATALRRGDVVVLDLAVTDQSVYKRLLDFSFGAASMVNARVDCLASKVFSIQVGEKLSSDEMNQLRNKGVL